MNAPFAEEGDWIAAGAARRRPDQPRRPTPSADVPDLLLTSDAWELFRDQLPREIGPRAAELLRASFFAGAHSMFMSSLGGAYSLDEVAYLVYVDRLEADLRSYGAVSREREEVIL